MADSDRPHRILVVDDNPAIHEDFHRIFSARQSPSSAVQRASAELFGDWLPAGTAAETYEIESASQGQDALEMVRKAARQEHPYLMAFVDVRMPPGWDGIETTSHIWQEFPDLQIVLCTAFSDYRWEDVAERLGETDRLLILKKPFDIAEVRQLAAATVTRARAERQVREAQQLADRVGKDYAKALADSTRMMEALRESEATIRAIVDTAAEGIILTDGQGIIETFNSAAEEIFGYRADEVRHNNISMLVTPETHREFDRLITKRPDDGAAGVLNIEGLAEHRRGTRFPVLVAGSEVRLGSQRLLTWLIRDISDRKQAEEQLAVFRRFVEASGQGFAMADLDGNVTYLNPTLRRLVGEEHPEDVPIEQSGLLHKSFFSHYPEELQEKVWKEVIPTVMRRGQWAGKLALRTSEGKVTPTLENYFLIRDDDGYPICLAAVVTDITQHERDRQELKEYADALETANKALEESCAAAETANRCKSEFLANMSHELRTPLHGILSFATFGIKKGQTAARQDVLRYFQKIDQSGRVLLRLVSDLLDLAKMESGRMSFELTRVDLFTLLHSVADEFSSTVMHRDIKIECRRPDFDGSVIADPDKIMQVVRNLLGNAVKFSPDGSTVQIEMHQRRRSIRVSVSDQGVGIPEEEVESIFDRFIQSSKTRTGAGGTGLGLAICREILSAHQGRIWAGNRPEGGAVVSFEIPVNLHEEPDDEDGQNAGFTATGVEDDQAQAAQASVCS